MTPASLRLTDLTWLEVAEHLAHDRRLIVPVGTCEQHGPHLPLGTDALMAERIALDLSADLGILVAPTLPYGVNVETEYAHPGRASLRRKTLHRVLNDLLAAWEEQGFEEFVLITAHSHDPHLDAVATVVTEHARIRVVDVYSVGIGQFLDRQDRPQHGGEAETSLLLYLQPEQVRRDRVQDFPLDPESVDRYLRGHRAKLPEDWSGVIGYPSAASAGKGERIYRQILGKIRTKLLAELEE